MAHKYGENWERDRGLLPNSNRRTASTLRDLHERLAPNLAVSINGPQELPQVVEIGLRNMGSPLKFNWGDLFWFWVILKFAKPKPNCTTLAGSPLLLSVGTKLLDSCIQISEAYTESKCEPLLQYDTDLQDWGNNLWKKATSTYPNLPRIGPFAPTSYTGPSQKGGNNDPEWRHLQIWSQHISAAQCADSWSWGAIKSILFWR